MSPDTERRRRRDKIVVACVAATVLCALVTVVVGFTTLSNNSVIYDQAKGRSAALDVTCATNKAIIEAGRDAILSSTALPPTPAQEQALRRLGFPAYPVRKAQARVAAATYAAKITKTVRDQSRKPGIVNRDGTINCARLKAVANAK